VHRIPIEDSLDLHTFQPRDIPSVVEEYVRAAHEAGLREVRLIHGRGTGVQRGIVQATLERHPLVAAFHDARESHLGATVAVLVGGQGSGIGDQDRG
jgi:DNA-nicking Smr family endonuclease